uniref:TEP1-F n=1 Tax=Stomoxys calcitrans TaxID=35570 RepID=A0A1I8P930_STOCA
MRHLYLCIAFTAVCLTLVGSESYYSLTAPGVIQSNRKYMVVVSLHEATEPAKINIKIQGPYYHLESDVYLKPYETQAIVFVPQKLVSGVHKLIVEGMSGVIFRNESMLISIPDAGPKIYIQTDKAVFKPGDEVKFRVIILDEHTRPLKVAEPIRIDILDDKRNRVKQFKDISLVKGVYKNKFQLSEYPVMGTWTISVSIRGKYDFAASKTIKVQKYILPKFSLYVDTDRVCLKSNCHIKAVVYGKYTFEKYVEGELTVKFTGLNRGDDKLIQEKHMYINGILTLDYHFDEKDLEGCYGMHLYAELREKHTGEMQSNKEYIHLEMNNHQIYVDDKEIEFKNGRPFRLKVHVNHWNGWPVEDATKPVVMTYGSKKYTSQLNGGGVAIFEFEQQVNEDQVFQYEDTSYTLHGVLSDATLGKKKTESYFRLTIKGDRPRFGTDVEIEVASTMEMPYLIYVIMAHSNIIHADHITLGPNKKVYTIRITPTIEMVPHSFVYVYYVQNGILRYEEIQITLPLEFENKISLIAPKTVKPGDNVTLQLNAQPQSLVGILAVDLGVYLLDNSYDLQRETILSSLESDRSSIPLSALVYPGLLSGIVTLTNAHYIFEPLGQFSVLGPFAPALLRFRKKFPETWIFQNYEITNQFTNLTLEIPDTVTSWRITAFSVNEKSGFGIVDGPTDITTIQPFFISLNLPYSIKRGEIVAIPVLVHNYQNQTLDTELKLFNEAQQFYFMESNILDVERGSNDRERIKRLAVPPQNIVSSSFLINPKEVGEITLRLTATNAISSDAIIHKLRVEPEGVANHRNKALYISVQPPETFKVTLPLNIPQDVVPNSEFISLSLGGDNMVPTLKNLNKLVRLPTGCGEQNMVNLAPNILVLQYLKANGQYFMQKDLVTKAKKFIEVGYQQELSFRHSNGAYSVFGEETDKEASTWLTAYVIRFFMKAAKYTTLDTEIVESGLSYLSSKQLPDGSFPYTGYLFEPAQQNRFGFTAFVLMAFLEEQKYSQKYQTTIDNGMKFLNTNLDNTNDVYALSIMAVAMKMAKHPNSPKVMEKLMASKQTAMDYIWWSQADGKQAKDVEITAYVLMALLEQSDVEPKIIQSTVKWLVEQRNDRGGFKSTHDTVVGLQALVKYSMSFNSVNDLNLHLQYSAKNNMSQILKTGSLSVDANNFLVLQTEELPRSTRSIEIETSGKGNSLLQLAYHFHTTDEHSFKHFHIQPKPKMLNDNEMLLEVCVKYLQNDTMPQSSATNMVIMEINLPSGYTSSDEYGQELLANEIIQKIETKNSDTTTVIYFEKLISNVNNCLQLLADKINDIINSKPAAIAVYDYYDISRHDTAFYSI